MRPQKLSLKNFMPFRVTGDQVHEVDFSRLDLFSITGPMASGKSALIDAMVWCLYGRTARYGADSKGVISTGEQTCEVTLDFTLGTRWFRAVRRTGKITDSGLSEREGEEWIQDASGSARLTNRIEELLGLDFDSFTKTVILPQGRYAEFLTSEPKKRRELLAKILELGVYARVADQAKLVADREKTRAETLRETLAQYAGLSQEHIALQKEELSQLSQRIEQVSQREQRLRDVAQHADQIAGLRSRVTELQTEMQTRTQEKELAQKKADEVTVQVASLTDELARIGQERESLGYDTARHEVVKRAVAHLKEWVVARKEAEQKNAEQTRVRKEVEALAQKIESHTRQVEQARSQHQADTATFEELVTEVGDVATLTEKLGAARRWKELQQEQRRLTSRIEALRQDHTATQHRLDDLKRQDASYEQTVRELKDKLEGAKEEERQKRQLIAEAERLGRELQEAAEAEERVRAERETDRTELTRAEHAAQQAQQALTQAEEQEQAARTAFEDNQRQHEAAHLRATLHVGDPCPVCQTTVSQLPVAQEAGDDLKMLQTQMERAARAARQKRTEAQEANTTVATRRARLDAAEQGLKEREHLRQEVQNSFVSRFPRYASPSEALQAVQTQQEELSAALKDMEAQVVSAEQEKARLSRQREAAQQEEATLGGELRVTTERMEADTRELGVLGGEIAAFLTPNGDPEQSIEQRRTMVGQAEQQMKAAEKALRQLEAVLNSLHTTRVQKDGDLKLLASEYEGALLRAAREAQAVRACLGLAEDAVLPQTEDVESELNVLSDKQTLYADLSQREEKARARRELAERQATESQADLQVRTQMLEESHKKQQQASNTIAEERERLRGLIEQHHLTDAGEDGEHVKSQLETVRGQMMSLQEQRGRLEAEHAEAERRWQEKEQEEEKLHAAQSEERLASDLRKLLGSEFTDFLSRGAIEALMRDASAHLQRLTHGRYVFDIAYRGRAITLQIVDHEDQRRARPTHSLSGGETFLASLAIALALSQGFRTVATGRAVQTSTECLILDEGFGTLDREGVQMVTETLQELRGEEGRMVGIITHVEEVAAAMPMRIEVRKGGRTSEITVSG
ncbi:MAG: SMC family ATPase [Desulfurellaceae bacterium]|nr:SMC family ATPase [Desulfurellaceae bacterium]